VSEAIFNAINSAFTLGLALIGFYLARNFREQLELKVVDRRLESYSRLWEILEVSGPWRIESGLGPMSLTDRRKLYDKMTSWYFGQGNGMLLRLETRELYLNAKFNLICEDEDLRLNLKRDETTRCLPQEPKERGNCSGPRR
jgi:hypothetical protein